MIFDCDGVLVDTQRSYLVAGVRTMASLLGPAAEGIDAELIRSWKRAGDWNNDWDLVYGLYCWRVAAERLPSETAARLPLDELRRHAGTAARLGYDQARGVFEEHYNGTAAAVARWGVEPRVHNAAPLAEDESVVLRAELLVELRALGIRKFGVVTGRDLHDWAQVKGRLPLGADVVVATDEDGRKPEPAALRKVLAALAAGPFVMVGDTWNDLQMVRSHNVDGRPAGTAVMLCPPQDEAAYRAAGATAFIRSLDDLPALLRSLAV